MNSEIKLQDLIDCLRGGRQCNEDGAEIIMSRQACVEAADLLEQLAKPEQPAWHDAPTCNGLWLLVDEGGNDQSYNILEFESWIEDVLPGERYFGPIPEDS
jgi:hypothetical protein